MGPMSPGRKVAQAAALDHGRAAHPDVGVLGGDDHVAAAEQGGVAGEAAARADARPAAPSPRAGRRGGRPGTSRPDTRGGVGVAGPAAAALGEEDDGQPLALGQLEEAVLLAVVLVPLRAGQDHVVVGGHDRPGPLRAHGVGVDGGDAADQPVGRGAGDQVVQRPPPALGRDRR